MPVGPSPIKKFEPTQGKFEDVIANGISSCIVREFKDSRFIAMVFEMNPELGTFSNSDKDTSSSIKYHTFSIR